MIKDGVTLVLPTCGRYDICLKNVKNILLQDYKPLQIIVCDDSDKDYYKKGGQKFHDELCNLPNVKYFYTARFDINGNKDYGLARSRNTGVIEATGEFIVFLDDRLTPANAQMVSVFVEHLKRNPSKVWFFGDKGAQKKSFVENCSACRRSYLVDAGLFCERIDKYGGMTREVVGRYSRQGFKFEYVPMAKSEQLCKSSGWDKKPDQIDQMRDLLKRLFDR